MSDVDRIRGVLAAYCQFLDDRRYVEFGQLFAPDGVWILGGREHRGPTAVEAFMDQLLLDHPNRRSSHMNTNVWIDVQGDTAVSTSEYVMFTRTTGAGQTGVWQVLAAGSYHDRLARQAPDGAWRFVERKLDR
jgi:uncharacterized protein (TIGR02246 family)